jgi:hypothetical protein
MWECYTFWQLSFLNVANVPTVTRLLLTNLDKHKSVSCRLEFFSVVTVHLNLIKLSCSSLEIDRIHYLVHLKCCLL